MTFLSPLWLLALIPWVGVALWLLVGRNPRVAVPFIELWNDSDTPRRRAARALKRPSPAIACALLAMLLALVAAAKPALVRHQPVDGPIASNIPENIAIVRVAVRQTPYPSVMLKLRNQSTLGNAQVRMNSASLSIVRDIELPARDSERDYFFDLDSVGDELIVELIADDGPKDDNRVRLVREGSPARLEPRSSVSSELARMIDVYSRNRAASAASAAVAIVDDGARLSLDQAGVVVTNGDDRLNSQVPLRVSDHPITAHVRDWNSIIADATVGRPAGDGWTPIVQAGDRALVSVRERPARQVWVAFRSEAFARRTDFVIFWTDVFDWLGGTSGSEFRADASSASDVKLAKPMGDQPVAEATDLSRALLLTALAFLTLATMLWNSVRSPKPPAITQDRPRSVSAKPLA